ncbi:unnamed protein product [Auanema sp. JU1783]|nr:unnamed protein product [Auanema sp. JU1783]
MYPRYLFVILLIICSVLAFDKNSITKKGKRDPFEKHPISRRVLRFERSVAEREPSFPIPDDLPYPLLDFAKILPELPVKNKPSQQFPDLEYQPEIEF